MSLQPRDALIAAGHKLARRLPLAEADADLVCEKARLPRAAFDELFPDFTAFLVALQQQFMDGLRDRIVGVTNGVAPGLMRVKLATEVYLEACIAHLPLRGWLLEARRKHELSDSLQRQNQVYGLLISSDLQAAGWPDPQAAARIYVAMANEAALMEHRAGHAVAVVREALSHFLDHAGPKRRDLG
ncbi:MAG TPA: hypothetical protein VM074_03465 [Solimonas sp.]|nr:hypothetical protein [Solimonas sp.]